MDKRVEDDQLISCPVDFAAELVDTFMQVSVKINLAELEVMANMLLDFRLGAWEVDDNSGEKLIIGNQCKF